MLANQVDKDVIISIEAYLKCVCVCEVAQIVEFIDSFMCKLHKYVDISIVTKVMRTKKEFIDKYRWHLGCLRVMQLLKQNNYRL